MAGTTISSLIVKLGAETSGFFKEIDSASKGLDRAFKPMANVGKELTSHVTLPLLAVGAAFAAVTVSAAKSADELTTMAAKTGLSLARLQELKYVASQTDTSFDSLSTAAVMLGRNIVEGSVDGSKMSDVLARLGLNTQDATGKFLSMDELFPQVISKLAGMEDKTLRNATAMELFGRGGAELIPMLDAGTESIEALTKRAHDLNLVMSDESVKALAGFYDKLDEVKQQFSMLGARIGASFMPIIQDKLLPLVQDKIVPGLEKFAGWVGRVADAFMDLAPGTQTIILGALGLTVALGPLITGFVAVAKNVGLAEIAFKAIALKFGAAGVAGHAAAAGTAAAGAAATGATVPVTGLGTAFTGMLGPIGLVVGALTLFGVWAYKATLKARETGMQIEGMADQWTYMHDQIEQDISLPVGMTELDETLSDLYNGASTATKGIAGFTAKVTGITPAVVPTIAPIDTLTTHLEGLQSAVSSLSIDLDISKVRFNILTGSMDETKDKAAILTATLAFEKEQLGMVEQRIDSLSDAYQHLVATKGADHEETKKALLDLEQEKLKRDDLTRSIAGNSAAIKLQNDAQAKTLTLIGEQQLKLLAAGDITGALTLQEVLTPGYKAPKATGEDVTAKAMSLAEGLHGAFPDKLVDFSKLYDILKHNPNADFGAIQKAVIGLAGGGTTINAGIYDVGERGRERVFLPAGTSVVPLPSGSGGFSSQTIIIELDGQEVGRTVIRNMPGILRVQGVMAPG